MKVTSPLTLLIVVSLLMGSCRTQQKMATYLQKDTDTLGKEQYRFPELTIQKNDMLSIQVYSASTKPEISDALYNLPVTASAQGAGTGTSSAPGFIVDNDGNIEYPRIGVLHVEGFTKGQLAELIKKKINEKDSVLINPSVIVRFQNLKVTVLGEVKNPGVINFPGERMTILEAIGLSGDIDVFGMKEKVKVVRETNGIRQTGIIDLSDRRLFESPYYILRQNDVVLVEASPSKARRADNDVALRRAGFLISIVTAIGVVVNLFR